MKNKILSILIFGILLVSIASAQVNYSKCIDKKDYVGKKAEKSFFKWMFSLFLPVGWISWLTGYATYEKEINCFMNETNQLMEIKNEQ